MFLGKAEITLYCACCGGYPNFNLMMEKVRSPQFSSVRVFAESGISPLGAALASRTQIRFSSLPNLRTYSLSALVFVLLSAVAVHAVHTVHLRARPPN